MIALLVAARDILIAVVLTWMGFGQAAPDSEKADDRQSSPSVSISIAVQ
jgi:hypothetical protein